MYEILHDARLRCFLKAMCVVYWALSIAGTLFAPDTWRTHASVALAIIVAIHALETVLFARLIMRSDEGALNGFAQSLVFGILWNYRYLDEDTPS